MHVLIWSILGIAFTRAMPSIIITLYFGKLSSFSTMSGAYVTLDASIF